MKSLSLPASIRAVVIEDNAADVYVIREALKHEFGGLELEVFGDGEAAARLMDRLIDYSSPRPDIILLDLNLPRCDGKEVLHKLRQIPGEQKPPVMIITSSNSPKDRDDCLSLGADCYFRKPSELREFMKIGSVVRDLLP